MPVDTATIQRVMFRAPAKDGLVDVMECGHILPKRDTLGPNDTIGARKCAKCESAAPVQMTSIPKLPRATRERLYWTWWYEARFGRELPMDRVKEIIRA